MAARTGITKASLKKYKDIVDVWFTNGFNGREAYKAFYKKVKDTTATTNFSKMKVIPEIAAYINERQEEARKYIEVSHEGVLGELKRWVESDITETMDLTPEQIKQLPVQVRRLITKYKTTERDIYVGKEKVQTVKTVEVHFISKEKALEMINKHIGFYEADNKQKVAEIDYSKLSPEALKNIWNARRRD